MKRIAAIVAVFTLVSLSDAGSDARANGRYPKAQTLWTSADGARVVIRATFGLLLSDDGGRSFRWVCEQALGFEGMFDPPIACRDDGRIHVGLLDGLRTTRGGCDTTAVFGFEGKSVVDVTLAPDRPKAEESLWVLTSGTDGRSALARVPSADRLPFAVELPSDFRPDTLEVSPAAPHAVYVTGRREGSPHKAHLLRSADGGRTWKELSLALQRDGRVFIAGVERGRPSKFASDRIWLRLARDDGSELLRSDDGGATFRSILALKGAMLGFARGEGGKVYAGSGDPKEGLFASSDGGETWEATAQVSVLCLASAGRYVYVCSTPFAPQGFLLARSVDDGRTLERLSTFDDVLGAIDCPTGAGAGCKDRFSEVRAVVERTRDETASVEATTDAPTRVATGAAMGTPAGPADSSAARSTPGDRSPSRPSSTGCGKGCRSSAAMPSNHTIQVGCTFVVTLLAWAARRRRVRYAGMDRRIRSTPPSSAGRPAIG